MDQVRKVLLGAIVVVAVVIILYVTSSFITSSTGYAVKSDDSRSISKCLSDNGVKVYVSSQCTECDAQLTVLGPYMSGFFKSGVKGIDCSQNSKLCLAVQRFPAIEYGDSIYYGQKTIDEIREITLC